MSARRKGGAFSAFAKKTEDEPPPKAAAAAGAAAAPPRRWRPRRTLTAEEAQKLLEALRAASTRLDFQKALTAIRNKGWGALKKREAVSKLLGMAWKHPIKDSGFRIDGLGFPEVLAAVRAQHAAPGIRTLSEEVERQLKFQPGDLFGSKAGALKVTSTTAEASGLGSEVEVCVRHATDKDTVTVSVPPDATMRQVKEAVAKQLDRPEVAKTGSMVMQGKSGALLPLPDSQRLGERRELLLTGVSLASESEEPKLLRDRPLNLGEAKEMLKAFKEKASTKEFQGMINSIYKKQDQEAIIRMQNQYITQEFNSTMRMFDFPAGPASYEEMRRGIAKHSWNVHVRMMAHEVERLMRAPGFFPLAAQPGEEAQPQEPPPQQQQPKKVAGKDDIEVIARHAVEDVEVRVVLPKAATFLDLKQEIARHVGRDEILRKGRLVKKKGGVYSSYRDSDPVGDIREVLVLGANLMPEEDSEDSDSGQPSKPQQGKDAGPKQDSMPKLSRQQALNLQRELRNGFSSEMFQAKLKNIETQHAKGTSEYIRERNKLMTAVQFSVLPRFGFGGDIKGVFVMRQALEEFKEDPEIQMNNLEINKLVSLDSTAGPKAAAAKPRKEETKAPPAAPAQQRPAAPDPPEPKPAPVEPPRPKPPPPPPREPTPPPPPPPPPPPEELELRVKHAIDGGEGVKLKVWTNWTFGEVKEALAEKLGRQEIKRRARIVFQGQGQTGGWLSFKDSETVGWLPDGGKREELFLLGVELPNEPEPKEEEAPAPAIRARIVHQPSVKAQQATRAAEQPPAKAPEPPRAAEPPPPAKAPEPPKPQPPAPEPPKPEAATPEPPKPQAQPPAPEPPKAEVAPPEPPKAATPEPPKPEAAPPEQPPTEVEVVVKHFVEDGTEVRVSVLPQATMAQVRAALAAKLGNTALLTAGKLAMKHGNSVWGLDDGEVVGDKRTLHLQDASLSTAPAEGSVEQARELMRRIKTNCEAPNIQKALARMAGSMRGMIFSSANGDLMKEYGFGTGQDAFKRMFARVQEHGTDPMVLELATEVEGILKVSPGGWFGLKSNEPPAPEPAQKAAPAPKPQPEQKVEPPRKPEPQPEPPHKPQQQPSPPPAPEPQAPKPSGADLAKRLLEEFRNACGKDAFQGALRTLHSKGGITLQLGMTQLMGKAAAEAVKALNLGTGWTLQKLVEAVKEQGADMGVRASSREAEQLLKLGPGALFGMAEDPTPAPAATSPADRTKQLLEEFERSCRKEPLQKSLQALHDRGGITLQLGLTQLMSKALAEAAKALDMGEGWVMQKLVETTKEHGSEAGVRAAGRAVEQALRLKPGALFGMAEDPAPAAPAAAPAPEPVLTGAARAARLLEHFEAACSKEPFQKSLQTLHERGGITLQLGLTQLMGKAVAEAVKALNLGDGWPLQRLVETAKEHGQDAAVRAAACSVERKLRLEPGALFGLAEEAKPKPPPPVELVVQHATDEGEVYLTVPGESTMREVLEALARALGRPEVATKGRLVKSNAGGFSSYPDTEKLNGRNRLLMLGVDLQGHGSDEEEESSGDERQQAAKDVRDMLGKGLAPAVKSGGGANLSLEEAVELQSELRDGFAEPGFQKKLQELFRKGGNRSAVRKGLLQLALTVQSKVLPKYGFKGSTEGVLQMMQVFSRNPGFNEDLRFQQNGTDINRLLGIEQPQWPQPEQAQPAPEPAAEPPPPQVEAAPAEVEIVVKHAVEDECKDEVRVTVLSNATMRDVKQALADQLERPEVLSRGRLVRRVGTSNAFSSFKDTEKMGNRRLLLIIGLEDLKPAGFRPAEVPEEVEPAKPPQKVKPEPKTPKPKPEPKTAKKKPEPVNDEPPDLSLEEGLALQRELMDGFQDQDFRSKLEELHATVKLTNPRKFAAERSKLLNLVQSVVLPRFGFKGNLRGVHDMLEAFKHPRFTTNEEFNSNGLVLSQLLMEDVPIPPGVEVPVPEPPPKPAREVEVRVRKVAEGGTGEEVFVLVPETATMGDIKAALADKVGNEEVRRNGRLVRKQGEIIVSYNDHERIGTRRRLLFLGADLAPPQEPQEEAAPEAPPEATPEPALEAAEQQEPAQEEHEEGPPGTLATPARARGVLRKVKRAVQDAGFQKQLRGIVERASTKGGESAKRFAISSLFIPACSDALQSFGFGTGRQDYDRFFGEVFQHRLDKGVVGLAREIEKLLTFAPGSYFGFVDITGYTFFDGWLDWGGDLTSGTMTLEQAKAKCEELAFCAGFTFEGSESTQGEVEVFFKGVWKLGGPGQGWCSCRVEREATPDLTFASAKHMLEEVKRLCGSRAFQRELDDIVAKGGLRDDVNNLLLNHLRGTALAYGCGADALSVDRMQKACAPHLKEAALKKLAVDIDERVLRRVGGVYFSAEGVPQDGTAEEVAVAEEPAAVEVTVKVKHALTKDEISVAVTSATTMLEIRQTMAQQLGKPDVLKEGRLVKPRGSGNFVSYQDTDVVGLRQRLLFLGPGLASEEAEDPAVQQVLRLLRGLKDACDLEGFQAEAKRLRGKPKEAMQAGAGALFLKWCPEALAEFGGDPGKAGYAITEQADDILVVELAREIEEKMHAPRGFVFGLQSSASAHQEVSEIEVAVKHAMNKVEVNVTVPSSATMRDVREALAKKLGQPQILQARLVRPEGTGFVSYKDTEQLGKRRRVLLLGVDLEPPQETEVAREVEVIITHAIQEDRELRISADSTATLRDIKTILAAKLREPVSKVRLVKRAGASGALVALKDSEALGTRRRLLLLGLDLPEREDSDADEPALSVERAAALLRRLRAAVESPRFQQELRSARRGRADWLPVLGVLFAASCRDAVLEFGFRGDKAGFEQMFSALAQHAGNRELLEASRQVERLLHITAGGYLGLEVVPSEAPSLSDEDGQELLRRLKRECAGRWLQRELEQLRTSSGGKAELASGLNEAFMVACSPVLLDFGFRPDATGFQNLGAEVAARPVLQRLWPDVEAQLRLEPPEVVLFFMPQVQAEVRVKHALSKHEAWVSVAASATMGDVKRALAEKLSSADVLSEGRLVRPQGAGVLSSYKDNEPLGKRRRLLFVGADLPEGDGPAEDSDAEEEEAEEEAPAAVAEGVPAVEAELMDVQHDPEVEVRVKHAIEKQEVVVVVKAGATMGDVRQALAEKLGRPEIAEVGRLVWRQAGSFSSYKDAESLGHRRRLLFLGCDLEAPQERESSGEDEATPKAEIPLDLSRARGLLERLRQVCAEEAFQQRLGSAYSQGRNATSVRISLGALFATLCADALNEFGYGSDRGSFDRMFGEVYVHRADPILAASARRIEELLRVNPGEWFGFSGEADGANEAAEVSGEVAGGEVGAEEVASNAKPEAPAKPNLVVVRVKHAFGSEEVQVTVAKTAVMVEIKHALAEQLGRQEVLSSGRLVKPRGGGTYTSYKDDEPLGKRRRLLFAGVELTPASQAAEVTEQTEASARALTLEEICAVLSDFRAQCEKTSFQEAIQEPPNKQWSDDERKLHVGTTFTEACREALLKRGLRADQEGYDQVFNTVWVNKEDERVIALTREVEELLHVPRGAWFGVVGEEAGVQAEPEPAADAEQEPAATAEVEVTVRHALNGDEVRVAVASSATLRQLREALAMQQGSEEILTAGRLVKQVGGHFASLRDDEKLGRRRLVLFLGMELRLPTSKSGLSAEEVKSLLEEMQRVCAQEDFQKELEGIRSRTKGDEQRARAGTGLIFSASCRPLLLQRGFGGDAVGFTRMFDEVFVQRENPEVAAATKAVEDLLQVPRGSWFGFEEGLPDIEVKIKHAVSGREVSVYVKENATIGGIKYAIAVLTGHPPEVLATGHIVRRGTARDSGYLALRDSERLGMRRRLLWTGPELTPADVTRSAALESDSDDEAEAPAKAEVSEETPTKAEAGDAPRFLSLAAAKTLLGKMAQACEGKEFQAKLEDMVSHSRHESSVRMGIGILFTAACTDLLKAHGFGVDRAGFDQMFGAVYTHGEDPEVVAACNYVERLLWMPPGSWFGIVPPADLQAEPEPAKGEAEAEPAQTQEVAEVEVRIKHAIDRVEVHVFVPSSATMREVLEALAAQQGGNREIVEQGRLVRPQGGSTFISYGMDDSLGKRRRLAYLGTTLDSALAGAVPEEATLEPPTAPFAELAPGQEQEEDVQIAEVVVRHAAGSGEVRLVLPSTCTLAQLRAAVADKIGQPDAEAEVRLVQRLSNGTLASLGDEELLGNSREVLVLGVSLPEPQPEPEEPVSTVLPLSKARRLLVTIRGTVKRLDVQKDLEGLRAQSMPEDRRRASTAAIFAHACADAMVAFGFGEGRAGFDQMFAAILEHRGEAQIVTMTKEIEDLLGVPRGSWFGVGSDAANITVRVKHALERTEVTVSVSADASMVDVKHALAKQLGRYDVFESGRLVKPRGGGTFTAYKDNEKLGKRARLLYMGTDMEPSVQGLEAQAEAQKFQAQEGETRAQGDPRSLSRGQAWDLMRGLLQLVKGQEFQASLDRLHKRQRSSVETRVGLGMLFIQLCRDLLVEAGFAGDRSGFDEMFGAVFAHGADQRVQNCAMEIEQYLHVGPGEWFGIVPGAVTTPPPQDAQVRVKHAETGEEVTLTVSQAATMHDVKVALSRKLGDKRVIAGGRLVKPGTQEPYPRDEPLRNRRQLLFIGAGMTLREGEEAGPPLDALSLEEAKAMLEQLRALCRRPEYQREWEALRSSGDRENLSSRRGELFTARAGPVLCEYGFGSDAGGFALMFAALAQHAEAMPEEVKELELLVGVEPGTILALNVDKEENVEVLVESAEGRGSVHVEVLREGTMADVRLALLAKMGLLGTPEKVQLVRGSGLEPVDLDEVVGSTRQVLLTGAQLLVRELSVPQAQELLQHIYETCQSEAVQQELATPGADAAAVFAGHCEVTLTQAGFTGNEEGLAHMFAAVWAQRADVGVRAVAAAIEELLGLPQGVWFGIAEEESADTIPAALMPVVAAPAALSPAEEGAEVSGDVGPGTAAIEESAKEAAEGFDAVLLEESAREIAEALDIAGLQESPKEAAEGFGYVGGEESSKEAANDSGAVSLEDAQAALERIRDACSLPDFQKQAEDPSLMAPLFVEACTVLATEFGFGEGEQGLNRLLEAVARFWEDELIREYLEGIEESMGMEPGSVLMMAGGPAEPMEPVSLVAPVAHVDAVGPIEPLETGNFEEMAAAATAALLSLGSESELVVAIALLGQSIEAEPDGGGEQEGACSQEEIAYVSALMGWWVQHFQDANDSDKEDICAAAVSWLINQLQKWTQDLVMFVKKSAFVWASLLKEAGEHQKEVFVKMAERWWSQLVERVSESDREPVEDVCCKWWKQNCTPDEWAKRAFLEVAGYWWTQQSGPEKHEKKEHFLAVAQGWWQEMEATEWWTQLLERQGLDRKVLAQQMGEYFGWHLDRERKNKTFTDLLSIQAMAQAGSKFEWEGFQNFLNSCEHLLPARNQEPEQSETFEEWEARELANREAREQADSKLDASIALQTEDAQQRESVLKVRESAERIKRDMAVNKFSEEVRRQQQRLPLPKPSVAPAIAEQQEVASQQPPEVPAEAAAAPTAVQLEEVAEQAPEAPAPAEAAAAPEAVAPAAVSQDEAREELARKRKAEYEERMRVMREEMERFRAQEQEPVPAAVEEEQPVAAAGPEEETQEAPAEEGREAEAAGEAEQSAGVTDAAAEDLAEAPAEEEGREAQAAGEAEQSAGVTDTANEVPSEAPAGEEGREAEATDDPEQSAGVTDTAAEDLAEAPVEEEGREAEATGEPEQSVGVTDTAAEDLAEAPAEEGREAEGTGDAGQSAWVTDAAAQDPAEAPAEEEGREAEATGDAEQIAGVTDAAAQDLVEVEQAPEPEAEVAEPEEVPLEGGVPAEDSGKVEAAGEAERSMEAIDAAAEDGEEVESVADDDSEEGKEDDEDDEEWQEASRIIDEVAEQLAEIMAATRKASKKEKQALMARKRELESSPEYVAALRYIEDPEAERERRALEASGGGG